MTGAIDYLCGLFTPENIKKNFLEGEEAERFESVGRLKNIRGYETTEFLAKMDEVGVDKVIIPSLITWGYRTHRPVEEFSLSGVIDVVRAAPDRIFGLYGVNCFRGMEAVGEFEVAVKEHGFKGLHIHPHGFGFPPSHANYYPFYAKCQELGVPAVISMGHTLDFMPMENGRPIHLDEVALYFPDLKIVMGHTGWPWVNEAIALVGKHPNMYLGTSAYAPKYWTPEMVQFLDSRRGRDKVIWGTDYPLVQHGESLEQIGDLALKDDSFQKLVRENAVRVFDL